jgi:hypothetical protein
VKNLLTKNLNSKKKDLLNAPGEFNNLLEAITKNYNPNSEVDDED